MIPIVRPILEEAVAISSDIVNLNLVLLAHQIDPYDEVITQACISTMSIILNLAIRHFN